MSNKLAIAMSDRLFSSCGFSRILYQKAWVIAELSLEVNHPSAMPDCRCNSFCNKTANRPVQAFIMLHTFITVHLYELKNNLLI
ncbi:hypothetical protein IQ277_18720 [Nostocales cyanobacterium LEGE 12452]|nr:hypothetical protein [Nostocales cyanobacterium LEGE 12452]